MWIQPFGPLAQFLMRLPVLACLGLCPHHPGTGSHANIPMRTLGGVQFWADVE